MSLVLSLLIFLPVVASPLVYLAARADRKGGIYFASAVALAVLVLSTYVFWLTYSAPPPPGQYSLVEKTSWISFQSFGLDYFLGVEGRREKVIFISGLLSLLVIYGSVKLIDHKEKE